MCTSCSVYRSLWKCVTTYPAEEVEIYHQGFQAVYTGAIHPSWWSSPVTSVDYQNTCYRQNYRCQMTYRCDRRWTSEAAAPPARCLQDISVWYGNTEPSGTMDTCEPLQAPVNHYCLSWSQCRQALSYNLPIRYHWIVLYFHIHILISNCISFVFVKYSPQIQLFLYTITL